MEELDDITGNEAILPNYMKKSLPGTDQAGTQKIPLRGKSEPRKPFVRISVFGFRFSDLEFPAKREVIPGEKPRSG